MQSVSANLFIDFELIIFKFIVYLNFAIFPIYELCVEVITALFL